METNNITEKWKRIKFDFEFTNQGTIEVSNLGRLRTFNKVAQGNIINGSITNGYKVIRLKLYSPRAEALQKKFDAAVKKSNTLFKNLRKLELAGAKKKELKEAADLLAAHKKDLSKKFQQDLKDRTINHHFLNHRIVAKYFLPAPKKNQTIVAHLDFNKLNNAASNLQWMTPEENYAHQSKSPYVIKEKKERKKKNSTNPINAKLTTEKVAKIKKQLLANISVSKLAKDFAVTETQIYRIKKGENWAEVKASK
jgi:hypothetical protein